MFYQKSILKKKYWKYIGVQALGLMLLLYFVGEVDKYDLDEYPFYVWALLSGLALEITYIGLKKQVKHELKEEQNAND